MKGLLAISKARKQEEELPMPVNKKSKKPKANFNIQNYLNSQEQSFSISQSNSASNKTTQRSHIEKNKNLERQPDEKSPIIQNTSDIEDEPPEQQIVAYAQMIGIRLPEQAFLLHIAKQGLMAQLPDDWDFEQTQSGEIVYFNKLTKQKSVEHPLDNLFRKKVIDERKKKSEIESALSRNKLKPVTNSAKTAFIKNPFGANTDFPDKSQENGIQNKSNFTLNQIIQKNTEKGKKKLNFLYGESDEEQWHPEEQDDEPASIFFNRSKSIKNFCQENESKLKNSAQIKPNTKNFDSEHSQSKIKKGLAIKISKELPQNQMDVDEVPKPEVKQKNREKAYFDRVDELFIVKDSDRIQKEKKQISDQLHCMYEKKIKEIDENQLLKMQKLRQMREYIHQNDLITLIQELDNLQLSENQNQVLKELASNPQCIISTLREQLSKRKKQIERSLLKDHSERVQRRKEETRKQISKRRKLKDRGDELQGLFSEMANFKKVATTNSSAEASKYLDQMEKNMKVIEEIENEKKMIEIEKRMRQIGQDILLKTKFNSHSSSNPKENWEIQQNAYRQFMNQIEHLEKKYFSSKSQDTHKNSSDIISNTEERIIHEKGQAEKIYEDLIELKNGLNLIKKQEERQSSGRQSVMTDRQSKLMDLLQGHQSKPNSARSK